MKARLGIGGYGTSQNGWQGEHVVLMLRSWNFAEGCPALKIDMNGSKHMADGLREDLAFPGVRRQHY